MSIDYKPRLSVEISQDQNFALGKLIPWGVKREFFSAIIDDVINLLSVHGEIVIAAVLTRRLKIQDFPNVKEILDEYK